MAATLPRILSFGKNTRTLLNVLKVSVVSSQHYSVPVSNHGEKVTHTGQVYDENDVRRARFTGRIKEVNENFAISLVAEEPVRHVESRVVSCDGGGGARPSQGLHQPRGAVILLNSGGRGQISVASTSETVNPPDFIMWTKDTKVGTCGYCGLQFKQEHHH